MDFMREESCGKCVPCRVGTTELWMMLDSIAGGRAVLGDLRQQPEDRQPDEQRVRRLPGAESERDGKRIALRLREPLHEVEDRRAQLLERRVRELHLPLDADRPQDAQLAPLPQRLLQQRGLAGAGLAMHDEDAAVPAARSPEQPGEDLALTLSAEQWLRL